MICLANEGTTRKLEVSKFLINEIEMKSCVSQYYMIAGICSNDWQA